MVSLDPLYAFLLCREEEEGAAVDLNLYFGFWNAQSISGVFSIASLDSVVYVNTVKVDIVLYVIFSSDILHVRDVSSFLP